MIAKKYNFLNKNQCEELINIANNKSFCEAQVVDSIGRKFIDKSHRGGYTCSLVKEDLSNLYDIIIDNIQDVNKMYYNSNINCFDIQVACYVENQQAFNWHSDGPLFSCIEGRPWNGRKLTGIVELSEGYEGGILEIELPTKITYSLSDINIHFSKSEYDPNVPIEIQVKKYLEKNKKLGSLVLFPSFFSHRVTQVTKGERYSLVIWCKGPEWI